MAGTWRRLAGPVVLGLGGVAILAALGVWQLDRRETKLAAIAVREARLEAAPVALPPAPEEARDEYQAVEVTGDLGPDALRILTTSQGGAGFRIVSALATDDGRRLMVDRGVVPEGTDWPREVQDVTVTGNLHWPDETGPSIPEPDLEADIWFGRDVPVMAEALGTEPVLVVASAPVGQGPIRPDPVSTEAIPNNHLGYAVQWFGMALAWGVMAVFLARRTMRG